MTLVWVVYLGFLLFWLDSNRKLEAYFVELYLAVFNFASLATIPVKMVARKRVKYTGH